MAVKRRVIWLSDEEWAILGQVAHDNGKTISEVIRTARFVHPSAIRDVTAIEHRYSTPPPFPEDRFDRPNPTQRPAFSPAPKPKGK